MTSMNIPLSVISCSFIWGSCSFLSTDSCVAMSVYLRRCRSYAKRVFVFIWVWVRVIYPFITTAIFSEDESPSKQAVANVLYDHILYFTNITSNNDGNRLNNVASSDFSDFNITQTVVNLNTFNYYGDMPLNNCGIGFLDMVLSALAWFVSWVLASIKERAMVQPIMLSMLLCLNDFLGFHLVQIIFKIIYICFFGNYSFFDWKDDQIQNLFEFASENIPFLKKELLKEEMKTEMQLKNSLWSQRREVTKVLPYNGMDQSAIIKCLKDRAVAENAKWKKGFVSGTVYSGETDHVELLSQVYHLFSLSNPLHPDIWPTINQCEAEVISMTANLLNGGDPGIVGTTTR